MLEYTLLRTFAQGLTFGVFFLCLPLHAKKNNPADFLETQYLVGKKIVIVGHPDCGFTKHALLNIPPSTLSTIKKHGLFVGPINPKYGAEELDALLSWNKAHDINIVPVSWNLKMKNVPLDSMPVFFFFKNGKLRSTVSGWPKDGSKLPELEDSIKLLLPDQYP